MTRMTGPDCAVEVRERTQDGNGDESGDGAGTVVETRGRAQDGNGDGSGDGNESRSRDGNRDWDRNDNEDGIGEGGREAKKPKKPQRSCRRDVGNGGDLGGGKRKKRAR